MNKYLLAILSIFACSQAHALPVPAPTVDRSVVIEGEIGGSSLTPVGRKLLEWAQASTEAVSIIISSPGGAVTAGEQFLGYMRAVQGRGVTIRCYVVDFAASLAFNILASCDERYALNSSLLLWHRAHIGLRGYADSNQLLEAGKDLARIDQEIFDRICEELCDELGEKTVLFHFDHETMHMGRQLGAQAPGFITTANYIPNLYEVFTNPKTPRMQRPMLMFMFGGNVPGQGWYFDATWRGHK